MASKKLGLFATIGFGLVAVACVPYFRDAQNIAVEAVGSTLTLRWSQAVDEDTDGFVASYQVEVDGVVVASLPGTMVSCELDGLTSGDEYTVEVTAFDNVGDWTGQLSGAGTAFGRLSTTFTAGTIGAGNGAIGCVALADTDGDRLADVFETDTGVYVNDGDTGTSPTDADTDNDGIEDGDEVLGSLDGLYLPAFGTSPLRQDILLEFDWFDDNLDPGTCSAHSHRPTSNAISLTRAAFEDAPVTNPDGSTGINLIADYGQDQPGDGPHTGGNLVPDADGVIAGGVFDTDFNAIRAEHLDANRLDYFHYVLMPHRYNTSSTSSGQAAVNGDRMIVSLYCYNSDYNVATTIVHELGHNLGLLHGGDDTTNYKPNYNSVMNYKYQFPGVDTNCTPPGDGLITFSTGSNAALDENDLDETIGICGGVAHDWNGSGSFETNVSHDINVNSGGVGDGSLTVLHDHDDWGNLNLDVVAGGNAPGARVAQIAITEQPVPVSEN